MASLRSLMSLILSITVAFESVYGSSAFKRVRKDSGCPGGMKQIIHTDFSKWPTGPYTRTMIQQDFGIGTIIYPHFLDNSANIVTDSNDDNVLQITYQKGCYGSEPGCTLHFKAPFGENYNQAYYSMDVNFGGNWGYFDWNQGGKLPGVCGGSCNTGGEIPDGYDGFSDRIMWRTDGNLMSYVYNVGMKGPWGTNMLYNRKAPQQTWIRLAQQIEMNDPGSNNGKIEAWVNGNQILSENGILWRYTNELAIDKFYFSTFFGGNTGSWAPDYDMSILFKNIRICVK